MSMILTGESVMNDAHSTHAPSPVPPLPVPYKHVTIPIAGMKQVYDVKKVDRALAEVSSQNDALRDTYQKMLRAGGERFAVKPSGLPEMDALYEDLPNFAAVLDDIKRQLALCVDSRDRLEITPMLLLGDPGIGKTHFAKRISNLLGTGFGFTSSWPFSSPSAWARSTTSATLWRPQRGSPESCS